MSQPHLPQHQSLNAALERSEPWAGLMQRLQESRARHAAVLPTLPPALRAGVRPGPLDDAAWVLLVDGAAHAAKLRQLLPRLEQVLLEAGFAARTLRIKVQPPAAASGA